MSDDPQQLSKTLLESNCYIFAEGDGLRGKVLQAKLEELNAGFPFPAETDFLLELVNRYPAPEPKINPIQAAIESGDPKEVFKVAPLLAKLIPLQWGIIQADIKEAYGKKINLSLLASAVKHERQQIKREEEEAKLDVADIAHDWAKEYQDTWAYDACYTIWRMWNGEYWQEQPKTHILDQYAVAALHNADRGVDSQSGINTFERLIEAYCLRDFTPNPNLINFANGTMELNTGQLRGYDKADNLTYCLPYNYNPTGSHPNIDRFLAEVLIDEYAVLALMAHIGLALTGDLFMHAFIGLIGKPRSGKSTILALINAACGATVEYAFSFAGHHIFSRDLEGKRSRYTWANKLAVCVDELPPEALREEELLKAMSAHGGVEMRGMFKDEQTNNRWKPKLIFTANEQPRYKDTSSAIKERAIFVEIMQARPKEKRNSRLLNEVLMPELGAFSVSCIELAQQVLNRGYYPLSKEMKRLLDTIANAANPLKDFLREKCIIDGDPGTREPTKTVYDAFVEYCEDNAIDKKYRLAKNAFSLTLHNMHIGIEPKHIKFAGQLKRGLAGMRLRTIDDGDPVEPTYTDDTPLVKPDRLTQVNDRLYPTVNRFGQPVERDEDSRLTVLTVKEGNNCVSKTTLFSQPLSREVSFPNKVYRAHSPLTPLTDAVNEPVECDESVNGLKNPSLTTVNHKPDFPCRFCNIREWTWSSQEGDYICVRCFSPAHKEVQV